MIKIDKGPPPASLLSEELKLNNLNITKYKAHTISYNTGLIPFKFTDAYKSDDVKFALIKAQHNKCCFCEAKFVNDSFHVEHFRPKGRVDTWPSGPRLYPGYYWLAYSWNNLYLSKGKTNTSAKKNFFPLVNDVTRNRTHLQNEAEVPYLIDPGYDEPRDHIRFRNEEIYGISFRGRKTIEILNLRNPEIDEARRTKFRLLNSLKLAIEILIQQGNNPNDLTIQNMINHLREAIRPQAEFSSMAMDLLKNWAYL